MDRYYVSIPDPTPTPEGMYLGYNSRTSFNLGFSAFRKDQFIDMARSILCAFYDDSEIMVANFLLESDIAHTDQQIAESLGLPQRQVRSALEARQCKEFIAEAEIPNVGAQTGGSQSNPYMGGGSAWYRICPDILSATWYRLTQTEKAIQEKLKSVQETESYLCYRCGGREFDSLRAVSLYSQTDGLFHCDICEDILQIRENKQIRQQMEGVLTQFYTEFEPIKERLEAMSRMFVPRPIVIKKTVHEKLIEQAKKDEAAQGTGVRRDFSHLNAAVSNLVTSGAADRAVTSAAPEWIRQAQTSHSTTGESNQYTSRVEDAKLEDVFSVKRVKLEEDVAFDVQVPVADVKSVIESAHLLSKKEEVEETETVMVSVGGVEMSLDEVRTNDSLIERMTDEEYTAYDALMQKLGFN